MDEDRDDLDDFGDGNMLDDATGDGCVIDAAAAFDTIHRDLKTEPARRLRRSMSNVNRVLMLHDAGAGLPH